MTSPKPSGFTVADAAKDRTLRQASLVRRQCPKSMLLKLHRIRYFGDDEVEEGEDGGFQILLPLQRSTEYEILLHACLTTCGKAGAFHFGCFYPRVETGNSKSVFLFPFLPFLLLSCLCSPGARQEPRTKF